MQSAIEYTQNQPGVVYDTSLEQTLGTRKTANKFSKIEKRSKGDIF